jgi:hypothetical protein
MRLVRDWSKHQASGSRTGAAEAGAREQEAHADEREARADLVRRLVDEAKAGRMPILVGELLDVVTDDDQTVLDRLAKGSVELQLPPGLDPSSS